MNLRMIGCTHQSTGLDVRQQLAFDPAQTIAALETWQSRFSKAEFVLLSTCNRVELYAAGNGHPTSPDSEQLIDTMLDFHQIPRQKVEGQLLTLADSEVVRHLYRVTASLESMVVGEPQILSQVKQAYQSAQDAGSAGPLLHGLFQSALHTAKRVSSETGLHKHRVSIPSVAIAELASGVFETFDDKHVLVLGAGEMADETLRYLSDAGKPHIHVVNRSLEHGQQLAEKWNGEYHRWDELWEQLAQADLAISTTAATEPLVTAASFAELVAPHRYQRPLFVLDLSVPRDFEPEVGKALGVYLYSLDDLDRACQRNRSARAAELPAAEIIVAQEAENFAVEVNRRATAPVISGLRAGLERPKKAELERLFNKLPDLDEQSRQEIQQFADRLMNKMLHPPLESLRDASQNGTHHGLLEAVRRLFRLED
ncbi:MAG: glutamyl-tRNA reductase [Planctomycetes bacterium]|nr:glutamyl-tRNA reductase [Planctomycetota bacterium]